MNANEQKKLAVIKSNAAPEVKLKALEILSNGTLEDYHKMTKANQTGDKKTALEIAQKLAQSGWKDSARMKDVEHVLKQLSNGYDNADSKLNGAEADKVSQMAKEVESVREEMGKIVTKFALTLDRDDIDPKLAQKIKTAMGSALGKLAEANLGSKELAQKYKGAQR